MLQSGFCVTWFLMRLIKKKTHCRFIICLHATGGLDHCCLDYYLLSVVFQMVRQVWFQNGQIFFGSLR